MGEAEQQHKQMAAANVDLELLPPPSMDEGTCLTLVSDLSNILPADVYFDFQVDEFDIGEVCFLR